MNVNEKEEEEMRYKMLKRNNIVILQLQMTTMCIHIYHNVGLGYYCKLYIAL